MWTEVESCAPGTKNSHRILNLAYMFPGYQSAHKISRWKQSSVDLQFSLALLHFCFQRNSSGASLAQTYKSSMIFWGKNKNCTGSTVQLLRTCFDLRGARKQDDEVGILHNDFCKLSNISSWRLESNRMCWTFDLDRGRSKCMQIFIEPQTIQPL